MARALIEVLEDLKDDKWHVVGPDDRWRDAEYGDRVNALADAAERAHQFGEPVVISADGTAAHE